MCGVDSTWIVMPSAPAFANSPTCFSGASIMRWTSRYASSGSDSRSAATTIGPKVIGGTKWPSMTSQWMTRAPASMMSRTWTARSAKSADRIEGATWRSARGTWSDLPEHGCLAGVAGQDRGLRHAHDRRMLAAIGAQRAQLEAVQAVHAAIAPGQVRRPQPRLLAVRACHADFGGHQLLRRAM